MTFKIMPSGPDVDLDKLEADVKSKVKVTKIDREPVAFGLTALNIVAAVPEEGGASDKAEEDLRGIENVSGVEVTNVTRDI